MSKTIYNVRITLKDSQPPIWRTVALPSDTTLGRLHEVIQIVMGWTDSHLHQFILLAKRPKPAREEMGRLTQQHGWNDALLSRMRGMRVFVARTDPAGNDIEMDGEDEGQVTLAQVCPRVKSKLIYEYDFGDDWKHTIEVQKIVEPEADVSYPLCLAGKNACPLEDSGGLWGYYAKLEALTDPENEMHEECREWFPDDFDPESFDLDEVNAALAEMRQDD
ncbi:MAG: plasmid pRiA4b ORF-3 family protein [Planctomycetota bacterium]|nr:plasmid pRiA4b ORF-3 family protein [Planctomycetota bacterium]